MHFIFVRITTKRNESEKYISTHTSIFWGVSNVLKLHCKLLVFLSRQSERICVKLYRCMKSDVEIFYGRLFRNETIAKWEREKTEIATYPPAGIKIRTNVQGPEKH